MAVSVASTGDLGDDEAQSDRTSTTHDVMQVTPDHPVYVEDEGWLLAENLELGDRLRRADGGRAKVLAIERLQLDEPQPVYNFIVKGPHTYFVLDAGLLVHNAACFNKVESGSTDLSQEEIQWRRTHRWNGSNNIAVFEYLDENNQLQTNVRPSIRHHHAERVIAAALEKQKVEPSRVTRIYSELQPCQGAQNCDAFSCVLQRFASQQRRCNLLL